MSTTGGRSASATPQSHFRHRPPGGDPRHRKRTAIGERGSPGRQASLLKKIAASSKRVMGGEPKSPRIPALGLAQALISKLYRFGRS